MGNEPSKGDAAASLASSRDSATENEHDGGTPPRLVSVSDSPSTLGKIPRVPSGLMRMARALPVGVCEDVFVVDWKNVATHAQARHHLFVIVLVLAYARLCDDDRYEHSAEVSCSAQNLLGYALKYDLPPLDDRLKPYPPNIWRTFRALSKLNPLPNLCDDLIIHTLEEDQVLGEFLFAICVSPSSGAAWVVLGSSDNRRLGQGTTEYLLQRGGGRSVEIGVDGYWGDNVLGTGQTLCKTIYKRIRYGIKADIKHVVICGYGGGGALAKVVGIYLALHFEVKGTKLSPQVWTYGAPKVGDRSFALLHQELEHAGKLKTARVENKGDRVPWMPLIAWDDFYGYWKVGRQVFLPKVRGEKKTGKAHSIEEYWHRVAHWKSPLSFQAWYKTAIALETRAQKVRRRRCIFFLFLLLTYLPILYVWTHPDVLQDSLEQSSPPPTTPICIKENNGTMCFKNGPLASKDKPKMRETLGSASSKPQQEISASQQKENGSDSIAAAQQSQEAVRSTEKSVAANVSKGTTTQCEEETEAASASEEAVAASEAKNVIVGSQAKKTTEDKKSATRSQVEEETTKQQSLWAGKSRNDDQAKKATQTATEIQGKETTKLQLSSDNSTAPVKESNSAAPEELVREENNQTTESPMTMARLRPFFLTITFSPKGLVKLSGSILYEQAFIDLLDERVSKSLDESYGAIKEALASFIEVEEKPAAIHDIAMARMLALHQKHLLSMKLENGSVGSEPGSVGPQTTKIDVDGASNETTPIGESESNESTPDANS